MQPGDFLVPEEKTRLLQFMHESAVSQIPSVDLSCWLVCKNGERRYVSVRYTRIVEVDQPARFFIILNDITELKMAEMKLKLYTRNEHELRQKLENEINKRIEFTRALVHELRTPLTPVINSRISDKVLTRWVSLRLARNIYTGATDLEQRVDELLDLHEWRSELLKLILQPV
jgi:signal transduction histidine kinase